MAAHSSGAGGLQNTRHAVGIRWISAGVGSQAHTPIKPRFTAGKLQPQKACGGLGNSGRPAPCGLIASLAKGLAFH